MQRIRSGRGVLAATFGSCLFFSSNASALGPVDIEVAARGGYGTSPFANDPVNALGGGVGLRAGISVFNVYLGATGIYYFGGRVTLPVAFSDTSVLLGGELGYNIKVSILTLRPQVGLGNYAVRVDVGGASTLNNNWYLEPGVAGLVKIGSLWLVGADANVLVLPGMPANQAAFTVHGQVGIQF
jgi:hypothetical protein